MLFLKQEFFVDYYLTYYIKCNLLFLTVSWVLFLETVELFPSHSTHLYHGFEGNSQTVVLRYGEKPWETVAQGQRPRATVSQGFSPYWGTTDWLFPKETWNNIIIITGTLPTV